MGTVEDVLGSLLPRAAPTPTQQKSCIRIRQPHRMTRLLTVVIYSCLIVSHHIQFVSGTLEILSFDKVAELEESVSSNTLLSTIDCSDTDGDPTTVIIQTVVPSSPCTNCFEILDCGTAECLQYRSGVGSLNYISAQSYLITVTCQDNIDLPVTEVIYVGIIPNVPPVIDPYTLYVDNPIAATGTAAGAVIYDVNAVDENNDAITYSMQVVPASAAFGFEIDSGTGEIKAAVDMRRVCTPHVTFLVRASDSGGTSRAVVINSVMQNANIAPVAMNLNREVQIPEDATGTVYTMQFIDDGPNALTFTTATTNDAGFAQFTIQNNQNIDTAAALDYEDVSLRQTYVTIVASDGYCESPQYFLTLTVMDVNEPPVVSPTRSTISVCEGEAEHDPQLTVIDPDTTETHQWYYPNSFNNFRGRFDIDRETGFLRTTLDYDVDGGAMASRWIHRSVYEDKGGFTDTVTVTVSYLDCNDNSPFYDGTTIEHRRTFFTSECTAGGTVLGRIDATDDDSDFEGNNVITQSGGAGCCRADERGRIIVDSALPAGNVVSFEVYATDQGQNPFPRTSVVPAYISVVFTVCPTTTTAAPATTTTTTTTATTPFINVTESFTNIPWIVLAAILGSVFLVLLTYMLWRYWSVCFNHPCCRSCKIKTRVSRPKPKVKTREPSRPPASNPAREDPIPEPEEIRGDAMDFTTIFWKTRFLNEESKTLPNLAAKPEPTTLEDLSGEDPLQQDKPATPKPAEPPKKKKFCAIL